ncbi:MAG: acetylxylan esterase [Planctomycetia bacterium]|nr:acetylxylan esterase [Planctomycetia bacterium]
MKTKADREKFRDERIGALKRSLGEFPAAPLDLKIRISGKLEGEGYRIHNLVYESRPGLVVTANLYLPAKPGKAMPGIIISHSQQNPKPQGELQDMGMTWARQGCLVLVPDVLGHGERRQHPFVDAKSYPGTFRVGRQDYYFRYNTALQLHAVGASLAGWMAWDLMRAVDVLLAQPGIDKERIVLLGSVAGGGDPAVVAAALDPRIAAVVPFNFGGPQADYAVPENAQRDLYWFGVPIWESTRCLRLGARDGFAHWLIDTAVAPRGLLYSHEFGWEKKGDPAWPRMQKVFALYDKADHPAVAAGRGNLKGRPPEHTHCNNIGALHRLTGDLWQ